jgi:hypothetical protein
MGTERIAKPALLLLAVACASLLFAQKKYDGPRPPQPDVPYLLHAGKLTQTEIGTAQQSETKDDTIYTVIGTASPARTPLAEPIFLFQPGKINPEKLSLYRMTPRGGQRVLQLPKNPKKRRDGPRPLNLLVTPLADGIFKVEVNEYLENGEYCLSPDGSNDVFCFAIY